MNGKLVTATGCGYSEARAVVLQFGGKLLVPVQCVTRSTNDFCTLRYTANGTLDTSFDNDGTLLTAVSSGALTRNQQ